MTTLAYLVFTFVACVLGIGFGLIAHRMIAARYATPPVLEPALTAADEEAAWARISDWQRRLNRIFAGSVATGAVVPAIMALAAWSSHAAVVETVCSGIATYAVQTPLCS